MTSPISITKKLEAHLTLLMDKYPDVTAIVAFSTDGLSVISLTQPGQDKEKISAFSAMLLKDAMKTTDSFEFGGLERILLVSEKGFVTVMNASEDIKIAMLCTGRSTFMKALNDVVKISESLGNR